MITYKTVSQWDADIQFKNMKEYQAYRKAEDAGMRIDSLTVDIKRLEKRLPAIAKYSLEEAEEMKQEIDEMKIKITDCENEKEVAIKEMEDAKIEIEEYGII